MPGLGRVANRTVGLAEGRVAFDVGLVVHLDAGREGGVHAEKVASRGEGIPKQEGIRGQAPLARQLVGLRHLGRHGRRRRCRFGGCRYHAS